MGFYNVLQIAPNSCKSLKRKKSHDSPFQLTQYTERIAPVLPIFIQITFVIKFFSNDECLSWTTSNHLITFIIQIRRTRCHLQQVIPKLFRIVDFYFGRPSKPKTALQNSWQKRQCIESQVSVYGPRRQTNLVDFSIPRCILCPCNRNEFRLL